MKRNLRMFNVNQVLRDVRKLCSFTPRIGKGEKLARGFIEKRIKGMGLDFIEHRFKAKVPEFKKFLIKTDSGKIECLPCGLKSGRFEVGKVLDFNRTNYMRETPFIGFSGKAIPKAISTPTFYNAPVLAVRKADVPKLKMGGRAELKVEMKTISSANVIVGHLDKAEILIAAHYDGLWSGAEDNACWVGILLQLLKTKPKNASIVFFGCEEIGGSFSKYWAHGSRMFAKNHDLSHIKSIFVFDGGGRSSPEIDRGKHWDDTDASNFNPRKTDLVVPKKDSSDVYHSKLDRPGILKKKKITESWNFMNKLIK